MSQGKQKKFLTIYFSVLGAGALVLAWLGWSASSSADDAETNYNNSVRELDRMEKAPLSRTKENATKKVAMVQAYVEQVKELNKTLMAYQTPEDASMKSEAFQKKLNEARDAARLNAAAKQVKVDEKFDLGMGRYLSAFPEAGAAPKLSAQLDALVFLANAAMDAGVLELNSMTRGELPVEKPVADTGSGTSDKGKKPLGTPAAPPAKAAASATAAKKAAAAAGPAVEEAKVLERQPVTLTVTGKNRSIQALLEAVANNSPEKMAPHFFVIRTLRVENQLKDGPKKDIQVTVEEEVPDPKNKEVVIKRDAKYLLGDEQVKMFLDMDLIRFAEDATPADKPGKPAPGEKPAKPAPAIPPAK